MKQQRHNGSVNRRPTFWVLGKITWVCDTTSALFEVREVLGKKHLPYNKKLAGLNVTLEGDNFQVASSLELLKEPKPFLKLGDPCGHRFVEGADIAALVSYFEEEEGQLNLGVRIIGWNHTVIFEPLNRQFNRLCRERREAKQEAERRSEVQKKMPYQIVYQGKLLARQSLIVLADFFQHRAFPEVEGLVYEELVRGRFQPTSTPAMLAKPSDHGTGIPIGRPPNIPELEFLLEMVKDYPVITSEVFDQEEDHAEQPEQSKGLSSVDNAFNLAAEEAAKGDGKTIQFPNGGGKSGKSGKGKTRKTKKLSRHERLGHDEDDETTHRLAQAS